MVFPIEVGILISFNASTCTEIIFSATRNSTALTNSASEIASSAHQPAVFLIQSGTVSDFSPETFWTGTEIIPWFTRYSIP
ncbi:MAG: Uncharacterised protein [Candidatus Nitrosopelagicus brevis]|nr:MAG: Uncharacterised protein [Candidatus Nitrosopelagicus brevis]